jgi:hypothetical protein
MATPKPPEACTPWRSGQFTSWKQAADKGLRFADHYATHGPQLA